MQEDILSIDSMVPSWFRLLATIENRMNRKKKEKDKEKEKYWIGGVQVKLILNGKKKISDCRQSHGNDD